MLSIVMPVYNGAETVARAVQSVCDSTLFRDGGAELILINDGSTDASPEICESFAARYQRISALHTSNQGVAAARNVGINAAIGTHCTFLDCDDFVAPNYHSTSMEFLHTTADFDILVTGFTHLTEGQTLPHTPPDRQIDIRNDFRWLVAIGLLNPVVNKIFLASFIQKHGIQFREGQISAEDLFFSLSCLARTSRIAALSSTGIYFVSNRNSSTSRLARRFDELHTLSRSATYRHEVTALLTAAGVADSDIEWYFARREHIWFYTLLRNIQMTGTPFTVRQQIQESRRIMDFEPARTNLLGLRKRGLSLEFAARILLRLNSPTLTWAAIRAASRLNGRPKFGS